MAALREGWCQVGISTANWQNNLPVAQAAGGTERYPTRLGFTFDLNSERTTSQQHILMTPAAVANCHKGVAGAGRPPSLLAVAKLRVAPKLIVCRKYHSYVPG